MTRNIHAYAYCREGYRLPLWIHLANTLKAMLHYKRLVEPLLTLGMRIKVYGKWPEYIVPAASSAAALLHDLGKGCIYFSEACVRRGKTGFAGHEIISAYYVLSGYYWCLNHECSISSDLGEEPAEALFALTTYGVLSHHHAMGGRGLEALYAGCREKWCGIRCGRLVEEDSPLQAYNSTRSLIRQVLGDDASILVKDVLEITTYTARRMGSISWSIASILSRMHRIIEDGAIYKALFDPNPPARRMLYLLRASSYAITGVISAADTLAANLYDNRPGKSLFYRRMSSELEISDESC